MSKHIDIARFSDEIDPGFSAHAFDQILAEARERLTKAKIFMVFTLTDDDDFMELTSTGKGAPLLAWLAFLDESANRIETNFRQAIHQSERRDREEESE